MIKFTYKTLKYELWYLLSDALLLHYRAEFMRECHIDFETIPFWEFECKYILASKFRHYLFGNKTPKTIRNRALREVVKKIQREDEAYRYIVKRELNLPLKTKLGQCSFYRFWEKVTDRTDFIILENQL